jgi:hypothetical protein
MCLQFLLFTLARWQPVEIPLTLTANGQSSCTATPSSRRTAAEARRCRPRGGTSAAGAPSSSTRTTSSTRSRRPSARTSGRALAEQEPDPADELVAPPFLARTAPELLEGQHPIIFGDHLGGVCSTIEGSSPEWDLHYIIGATHHKFAELSCAWWMEWVPTDANPADECLEAMCRLMRRTLPGWSSRTRGCLQSASESLSDLPGL